MRNHRICSRPHVQGEAAPLRVRHSARKLTDGGGLILVRRLWDDLGLGSWIDRGTEGLAGFFRPSLMVEVWVVLLLYGGRVLDDLPLLDRRGIRRLFGWTRLPDPNHVRTLAAPRRRAARAPPRRTSVAGRVPALETEGRAPDADPDPRLHRQRALRTEAGGRRARLQPYVDAYVDAPLGGKPDVKPRSVAFRSGTVVCAAS